MDVATKPTAQINNKTTHCYRDNTEKTDTPGVGWRKTGLHTSICILKREPWIIRSSESTVRNYYRYKLCENRDPRALYILLFATIWLPLWPFFLSLQFCKFWFSLSNCREERDQEEGDDDADIEQWWYEPRTSAVDASTAAASAAAMDGYAVPCGGYGDAAPDDVPAALHALPASSTSAAVPESSTAAPDARINRRD